MNRARLNCVREHMKEEGLQQILVSDDDALVYLLGSTPDAMERLGVLLIKEDSDLHMFVNRICRYPGQDGITVHDHGDDEDPLAMLAAHLSPGKVGVDRHWPSKWLIELLQRRPDILPVHGSGPVDNARIIKDEREQCHLREAAKLNDKMMADAVGLLGNGMTERELSRAIGEQFASGGAGPLPSFQLVAYGANCAEPHHVPGNIQIKPGDSVIFDLFAPLRGYWCDMTRTVFYREVSESHRKIYEVVKAAQQAAIGAVRPGVPLRAIDAAARNVISGAGFGEYFITRTGHGTGMTVHEAPDCHAASKEIAAPGMCFSIEPGIYLPGDVGIRIEDLVLVTESGVEVLTHYPKNLMVIE